VSLKVRKEPLLKLEDYTFFRKVIKAAFSQRRKTAENSISAGLSMPKAIVKEALEKAGLEQTVRAEKMTMEDFAVLAKILEEAKAI
jgi:16S rRNA (adenine1518-N6/adenine1519-N6)-dimethyltransferase